MEVREISKKSEYEAGLNYENVSFLQSYEYGQLHDSLGNKPLYLGIYDGSTLIQSMLFLRFNARRGTYLFGPYIQCDKMATDLIIPYLKAYAKKNGVDFIRISPLLDDITDNLEIFRRHGARSAPVHMMHPELLWLLDLNKTEDQILSEMRKNTRYDVRRSQREPIKLSSGATQELLDQFYSIHLETSRRHDFVPYPKSFLDAQLKVFAPFDAIKIYVATYEEKPIAGAVVMFYGEEGSYHHGASLSEYNKIPASHLIQWTAMMDAKAKGLKRYNFWGVVNDAPKHPWAGLSFFKQGFGGYGRKILHCIDFPITKKYSLNWLIERSRRFYRGY